MIAYFPPTPRCASRPPYAWLSNDGAVDRERRVLKIELRRLDKEIASLTNALTAKDAKPQAVVQAIADWEGQMRSARVRMEVLKAGRLQWR